MTPTRTRAAGRPATPSSPPAGYSGTPLPKKLGIKPGSRVALLGAPPGFEKTLGALPEGAILRRDARSISGVVVLFARSQRDLARRFPSAVRALADPGALWIAWPKKASKIETDLDFGDQPWHGNNGPMPSTRYLEVENVEIGSLALAALEAVDQLSLEREPNPQLYRMLVGVLRTIAASPSPLNVPAFYWKLLANEGVRPQLDVCVRCGSGPSADGEPGAFLVAFDPGEGGALCRDHRSGQSISPAALELMRDILDGRLVQALASEESPTTHEVAALATRALEFHIERRLKAVAMFEAH